MHVWAAPTAKTLRSGMEITGYALATARGRGLHIWVAPTAKTLRSGMEITGYALLKT